MSNILKIITFELPVLKNSCPSVLYKLLMPGALRGPSGRVSQGRAKVHENVLESVAKHNNLIYEPAEMEVIGHIFTEKYHNCQGTKLSFDCSNMH